MPRITNLVWFETSSPLSGLGANPDVRASPKYRIAPGKMERATWMDITHNVMLATSVDFGKSLKVSVFWKAARVAFPATYITNEILNFAGRLELQIQSARARNGTSDSRF